MDEELLSRRWTDQALLILSPALDAHIEKTMQEIIGHDVPWTYVLTELDSLRGRNPRQLSRRDPAVQLRMITERLGDLGYPFDRENRNRLFSTYGQMLRLARNQLSHPDDVIEPIHAMTTITTATQLASLMGASETVAQLNDLQAEVLEYLWAGQEDDEDDTEAKPSPTSLAGPQTQASASDAQSIPDHNQPVPPADTASAKGSLSKRIVDWEPIAISPIGERDDLNNLRRVSSRRKVVQAIETVIDEFGPVSERQLLTSVSRAFGIKRKTSGFRRKIQHQIDNGNAAVWRDQDGFYWPNGVDPIKWRIYRRDPQGNRRLRNVSPYELMNLIEITVREAPEQHTHRSLRNTVRDEFGLKKLQGPAREQVRRAIHLAITHQVIAQTKQGKFVPGDGVISTQ